MFVGGVFRDHLTEIPELDDAVAFETEDVSHRDFYVTRFLHDSGISHHLVALLDCELRFDALVRALLVSVDHRVHQRLAITLEILIVVDEIGRDEFVVCDGDVSTPRHFQKLNRSFFSRHRYLHSSVLENHSNKIPKTFNLILQCPNPGKTLAAQTGPWFTASVKSIRFSIRKPKTTTLRAIFSLALTLAFFASFFAPEFLHSAAHALGQTEHVEAGLDAHGSADSVSQSVPDLCPFSAILSAHTSHAQFTASQPSVALDVFEVKLFVSYETALHFDLAHLLVLVRGPPATSNA